ncbi:hypothetical protein [Thalassococcus sp. S3]|uniref:hypothetical protein n=1 Tax=Thalassococcus sp. S3 TaxID=2017482 RepID=UPI001023FFAC|nr:hypothetical protein [Thalassococcus sp. S3]QBF31053.1 hypothetical protein CFI11_07445 [Thalassococcus sp. S3]
MSGFHAEPDALLLYQDALDTLARAILEGDMQTVSACVKLPCLRQTLSARTIIETEEDLLDGCRAFSQSLKGQGVNQLICLASDAEFLRPDFILGHHVTHTLRNATRIIPSYTSRIVLQMHEETWKFAEVHSAVSSPGWPLLTGHVPQDGGKLLPFQQIEGDIRRSQAEPMTLYQGFIDALTQASLDNDFEAYCALCRFPYTAHGEVHDKVLKSPADIRPFFDMLLGLIRDYEIDSFVREAAQAEFLSGNLICGYHTTTMSSRGEVIVGPVRSRMILEREGTTWRMTSATNAVANTEFPYTSPEPSETLVTLRQIQERTRT